MSAVRTMVAAALWLIAAPAFPAPGGVDGGTSTSTVESTRPTSTSSSSPVAEGAVPAGPPSSVSISISTSTVSVVSGPTASARQVGRRVAAEESSVSRAVTKQVRRNRNRRAVEAKSRRRPRLTHADKPRPRRSPPPPPTVADAGVLVSMDAGVPDGGAAAPVGPPAPPPPSADGPSMGPIQQVWEQLGDTVSVFVPTARLRSLTDPVLLVLLIGFGLLISVGAARLRRRLAERGFLPRVAAFLHMAGRFVSLVLIGILFVRAAPSWLRPALPWVLLAASVAVGWSARDLLPDLLAGGVLLSERRVTVGVWISGDDFAGTVEQLGLRGTWLRDELGRRVSVPNRRLLAGADRHRLAPREPTPGPSSVADRRRPAARPPGGHSGRGQFAVGTGGGETCASPRSRRPCGLALGCTAAPVRRCARGFDGELTGRTTAFLHAERISMTDAKPGRTGAR